METLSQTIPIEGDTIRWVMPPAGRERRRKQALREAALHIPMHLVILVVGAAIGIHFMLPAFVPITAIPRIAIGLARSLASSVPLIIFVVVSVVFCLYVLTFASITYEVGEEGTTEKNWAGRYLYKWSKIGAYKIVDDPKWPSLMFLKLKMRRMWVEWPFDPTEVNEAQIRRLLEEHGVRDADGGQWFERRRA